LRSDDPERPLRVPLDEGAVRLGSRDVAHAACDHVDHAPRPAAAPLADCATERVLGERGDHAPRDLLGVAGPAVRGGPGDPELRQEPLPRIGENQFLVRNLYLSCDPAQRTWMARDTYVPAIPLGDVMRSGAAGQVVASHHPGFREGDLVSGLFGWQDFAISDGRGFVPVTKLPPGVPIAMCMSVLGITGLTAYFGMLEVGGVKAGENVLVSGAAGATGSVAAQIAKLRGARVVGIAGGAEKRRWLTQELGLDAAIDYRSEA